MQVPGKAYSINRDAGGGITAIEVRGADLPPPERSLTTDWVRADYATGNFRLIFGQLKLDGSGLHAALVVQISYAAVHDAFYSDRTEGFIESLKNFRSSIDLDCTQPELAGSWMTERVVVERARLMSVAFMAEDADIRFYRMSPSDYQAIKAGKPSDFVYPVVEVTLGTGLLCALVEQIEAVVKRVGPPKVETK